MGIQTHRKNHSNLFQVHLELIKRGAINLDTEDESDDSSTSDEDRCSVCGDWQPEPIKECHSIIFVKWAKCDHCTHWTHPDFLWPPASAKLQTH